MKTNDTKLIFEKYKYISEAQPYGLGQKILSSIKSVTPFAPGVRAGAKVEKTFGKNVNYEYNKFLGWLKTQPDSKPTGNNFINYFKAYIGLDPSNSPTLTEINNNPDKEVSNVGDKFMKAIKDYESSLVQRQIRATQPIQQPQQPQRDVSDELEKFKESLMKELQLVLSKQVKKAKQTKNPKAAINIINNINATAASTTGVGVKTGSP